MILGLTGGFGCGKSTALKSFSDYGARVIDCDLIVRDLLKGDEAVRKALRRHFGDFVFNAKGRVDRAVIAGIVFSKTKERAWLENLLHPLVRDRWEACIAASPKDFWVIEIPLLFEKNLAKLFKFTVCISASQSIQLARLKAKGLTADQIQERISQQLPLAEKIQRADFVISNNGSIEFLNKQIALLSAELSDS